MSLDGYLDDTTTDRLLLSNAQDFDRVDELRASCDAIMIGATTVRRDNPRLLVNSETRRQKRLADGHPEYPLKVTITRSGLDPQLKFFNTGGDKLVYCSQVALGPTKTVLRGLADVVGMTDPTDLRELLLDLCQRGVRRLMVEGGGVLNTQFLTQDLVDEFQIAFAPFFVGDLKAPRHVGPGVFPQSPSNRMIVKEVRQIGDMVFARYVPTIRTGGE